MAAGIDVHDIDIRHPVEVIVLGKPRIGVHHARVEARAENGGNALLRAFGGALPLVVPVPGRRFADLSGLLVDGGIDIGHTRIHAGAQHRHVEEGGADIDDDPAAGLPDQVLGRPDIESVQRMGLDPARLFHRLLSMDRGDDRVALGPGAGCDMDVAEHVVVLRAFVRHNLGDAAGADDEDVLLHVAGYLLLSVWKPYERLCS